VIDVQTVSIPLRNDYERQIARIWRGNAAKFRVCVLAGDTPLSVANLASITFEVDDTQISTGSPLMIKTVAAAQFGAPTAATWAAGTAAHAVFSFTDAECNIALGGQQTRECWLVIHAVTVGGDRIVLGHGALVIEEDNAGSAGTPPTNDALYYTAAESLALFQRRDEPGANFRFRSGQLQLWDSATATWHAIGLNNGAFVIGTAAAP